MIFFISIVLFLIIFAIISIRLFFIDEFFDKIIMFFYFMSNLITFMLIYFIYSNKFSFIIEMIFPLIILNMVLILLFIKSKVSSKNGRT